MKASARLVVTLDSHGNSVVRVLRSMTPLTLVPHRRVGPLALVHLVSSVTAPLGGDSLSLTVEVGPGASLELRGVAATLLLPGSSGEESSSSVRFLVEGSVRYLPEPTVVTSRANHTSVVEAELDGHAQLRTREVLVLGRAGEKPGTVTSSMRATRCGKPLLHQQLVVGDPLVDASAAGLAGRRVVGTEVVLDSVERGTDGAEWWSVVPLAAGGSLATALGDDVVTVTRVLDSI
ncbi:urease accessory protein UreD [Lentzea flaviverrucosa]|uniref:Urease accessory protein UreD n=1 Tax=Lentzea flaviverrucosa TaxID=200379 RepID=A0A1H9LY97_9PSEU|nr:urease accessory protein UreD [Lentzea flaviverrucosa]RDI31143.1 urease accessory protein [Lentzea flaviverrucosa]SER16374.1 urease accessory protein [Lentzea flaviverrucosa]